METSYLNDYIVTWESVSSQDPIKEGYTESQLEEYFGDDAVAQIQQMFSEYNHGVEQHHKRIILKIEYITRKTIYTS